MPKPLIPVDGSRPSIHAVHFAVRMLPLVRDMAAHLLNVQEKIDSWEARGRPQRMRVAPHTAHL